MVDLTDSVDVMSFTLVLRDLGDVVVDIAGVLVNGVSLLSLVACCRSLVVLVVNFDSGTTVVGDDFLNFVVDEGLGLSVRIRVHLWVVGNTNWTFILLCACPMKRLELTTNRADGAHKLHSLLCNDSVNGTSIRFPLLLTQSFETVPFSISTILSL